MTARARASEPDGYGDPVAKRNRVCVLVDERGNPLPLPPHVAPPDEDIVMPAGWLRDAEGRGLSVMEMTTLGSVSTVGDIAVPSQDLTTRAA
jgi:hypothetical protein